MAVAIKPEQLRAVALNAQEYRAIVQALGRDPNDLELGIFGALWSEHCAYKTSKALLRQLPTEGSPDMRLGNAMGAGWVRHEGLRRASADRAGDVVLLVGADTGRDGIHGATFASVEMDERSAERRPAVQVGNPFLEKLLCEACLRLNELTGVTAIQDLGAAGLTSAAGELAHRGRRG